MPSNAPYGSWESPIAPTMLTESAIRLSEICSDGGDLYWLESRPTEGGRSALVKRDTSGAISDVVPPGFDARTRVHEYGGGSYVVSNGVVVASSFEDQRVYRIEDGRATPITPEPELPAGDRYSDFVYHHDWIICVREQHPENAEPVNALVSFPADGSSDPVVIAEGHDFYSDPRVNPSGDRLVWLSWDHPNMPWDGTELWSGALSTDGTVSEPERIAGGENESIFQPEWSPKGVLHFVSDRSGWWNIYRYVDGHAEVMHAMNVEFGAPQWVFRRKRYAFLDEERVAAVYTECGVDRLAIVSSIDLDPILTAYTTMDTSIEVVDESIALVAGSSSEPPAVVLVDPGSGTSDVLRSSVSASIDAAFVSEAKPIEFPTTDGAVAHAFYYPPHNPNYMAPDGELPPLIVFTHGGPTGYTTPVLNLMIQFWTSRGFAIVDVNYRGSAGYGRQYRNALRGEWGVADLDDCVNAAMYLADEGLADGDRLAIRGGSAGGYTTLCALTFTDVFSAGASYFGVGDLGALAAETHKFESRYLDRLIGPYPEAEEIYDVRSPVKHPEGIDCPVILFQGSEDKVVLPAQALDMVDALEARQIPHAYFEFEGEGHGFRKAENIVTTLESELSFYAQVFGFEPAGDLTPVQIAHAENL